MVYLQLMDIFNWKLFQLRIVFELCIMILVWIVFWKSILNFFLFNRAKFESHFALSGHESLSFLNQRGDYIEWKRTLKEMFDSFFSQWIDSSRICTRRWKAWNFWHDWKVPGLHHLKQMNVPLTLSCPTGNSSNSVFLRLMIFMIFYLRMWRNQEKMFDWNLSLFEWNLKRNFQISREELMINLNMDSNFLERDSDSNIEIPSDWFCVCTLSNVVWLLCQSRLVATYEGRNECYLILPYCDIWHVMWR